MASTSATTMNTGSENYNHTNQTNETLDEANEEMLRHFYRAGIWEFVVAFVGTPANLLVLCLSVWLITGSRRQSRRFCNHWYVLSMTGADTLFTGVHAPLFGYWYVFGVTYSGVTCHILYIATHLSTVASSLSLLLLNVDKFVAIHKPLHHHIIMSERTAGRLLGCAWLVAFSWALFVVYGPFMVIDEKCSITMTYPTVYYAFCTVFFVVPILVSFVIAVYVVVVTARVMRQDSLNAGKKKKDRVAKKRSRERSLSGYKETDAAATALFQRHQNRPRVDNPMDRYKAHAKTVTYVFCTTVWSMMTSVPYRLGLVCSLFGYIDYKVTAGLFALMAANGLGNPFITICTQRQYTSNVQKLIKCKLLMRKSSSRLSTTTTPL